MVLVWPPKSRTVFGCLDTVPGTLMVGAFERRALHERWQHVAGVPLIGAAVATGVDCREQYFVAALTANCQLFSSRMCESISNAMR